MQQLYGERTPLPREDAVLSPLRPAVFRVHAALTDAWFEHFGERMVGISFGARTIEVMFQRRAGRLQVLARQLARIARRLGIVESRASHFTCLYAES